MKTCVFPGLLKNLVTPLRRSVTVLRRLSASYAIKVNWPLPSNCLVTFPSLSSTVEVATPTVSVWRLDLLLCVSFSPTQRPNPSPPIQSKFPQFQHHHRVIEQLPFQFGVLGNLRQRSVDLIISQLTITIWQRERGSKCMRPTEFANGLSFSLAGGFSFNLIEPFGAREICYRMSRR